MVLISAAMIKNYNFYGEDKKITRGFKRCHRISFYIFLYGNFSLGSTRFEFLLVMYNIFSSVCIFINHELLVTCTTTRIQKWIIY